MLEDLVRITDVGLAAGEDKDLEIVREWARKTPAHKYPWYLGYGGIPLCEYYLRTGDPEVLPGIQKWVDNAVKAQYLDGWAGRGGVAAVTTISTSSSTR